MANTIDTALLLDTLSNQVVTYLPARLAPLGAFSRDFSTDELNQKKSVQVPKITGGSTTLVDPTSFESGDSTTDNIAVTVNHYSQPFHITSEQFNNKLRIEMLAQANLYSLQQKIADVLTALFVDDNTTPDDVVKAQASFDVATAQLCWASIPKVEKKYLLLDSVAYSKLLPSDKNSFDLGSNGAYGFAGIYQQTSWTSAATNAYGIVCGPEAVAVAAGIPMQVPGLADKMIDQRIVTLPQIGLSVQINVWVSTSSRALWASYDVMFGAAIGEKEAIALIKSA